MKHEGGGDTNCNWYVLRKVPIDLVSGLDELVTASRAEIIQNTAFFKSARILRSVLDTNPVVKNWQRISKSTRKRE